MLAVKHMIDAKTKAQYKLKIELSASQKLALLGLGL